MHTSGVGLVWLEELVVWLVLVRTYPCRKGAVMETFVMFYYGFYSVDVAVAFFVEVRESSMKTEVFGVVIVGCNCIKEANNRREKAS
jgi:hypothetical protein